MNELIHIEDSDIVVKEYNGQRVVTLKDIDMVHQRPDGTARKRFNDNKSHFVENEDYFKTKCSEVRPFFGQTPPNGFNPEADIILLTESGYLMLVKSFTDDLAWKVQKQLVKVYFKATKPMTTADQIKLLALGNTELNERVDKVENKIISLENDMPLYGCEIDEVSKHVKRKAVNVLGGKDSIAYHDGSIRSQVFADIYTQIKREYGLVASYKSIKRKYLADVHDFIDCYELPRILEEQVNNANGR